MANTSNLNIRERKVILNAHKSIILFDNKLWIRKDTPECFNIAMGMMDSAHLTDLVGLYLLREISNKFDMLKRGLYRDDALFIGKNCSNRKLDQIRKKNDTNSLKDTAYLLL